MRITRHSGSNPLRATNFQTWGVLAAELGLRRDELATRCVFSDLSLGAWRGHWVGRELCSQLGVELPAQRQPRLGIREDETDESRYLGALTDHEGLGDFNTLMAHQIAVAVLDAIRARGVSWIVVLAPAAPRSWGAENLLLLDFLAHGCADAGCALIQVLAEPAGERAPGQLSAVPGIIPQRFAGEVTTSQHVIDAVALGDGRLVLSPRSRQPPDEPAREVLGDFLAGQGSLDYQWLAAYAFCDDHPDADEIGVLFASARERSAEGGDDVAIALLSQAKKKTSDVQLLGVAEVQLQNARLRLRRWTDLVAAPLPDDALHPRHRMGLHFSKAWGLVMMNRAAEAEPHLQVARELCANREDSKFYLYLLNFSALNKARLGSMNEAFELEKLIERRLADERPTDWPMVYINNINQARLYKRANDISAAQRYYDRAFAITDGLRPDSDLLYTCLCSAQMAERTGDHTVAAEAWLRAAIHWLANPVPEALAPRVAEAVLGGAIRGGLVETVSARLHDLVAAAWARAGRSPLVVDVDVAAPSFTRADHASSADLAYALGAPGWSVFVGAGAPSSIYTGAAYARLAHQVWAAIRDLAGTDDLPPTCALYADSRYGVDLPVTAAETVDAAIRHGVAIVRFAGRRVEIDADRLARTPVGLAPAVATIDSHGARLAITFKRYLPPVELVAREAELVRALAPDSTVASLAARFARTRTREDVIATLRTLEAKRVVRLGASVAHPAMELVCSLANLVVHGPVHFGGIPPAPPRDAVLRVSRFAYVRHERELVMHSPRGHAHLVVLAPEALAVYHAMCAGRSLDALERELAGSVDARELGVFVRLALAAAIVVTGDEAADPALRTWQFHDLLFLAETRVGRSTGPVAGSYRFARDEPPPAVKEPGWSGASIELARPEAGDPATAVTLDDVLDRRRTLRQQGRAPITLRQLGEFLYRTARIVDKTDAPWQREYPMGGEYTRRLYPNAGSRYGLELYVTANRCEGLAVGTYYYDALAHRFVTVSGASAEVTQLLTGAARASGAAETQVLITIASRFARTAWKYEGIALALELKNLGVLYAHMYLVATAMGLAPCALGSGNSELFCRIAKTDYLVETSIGEVMLGSA